MSQVTLAPNAVMMISSIRSLGYTFETALADVIDNSIAAGADFVGIRTEEDPKRSLYLAVVDNGCGMSAAELQAAMQHACGGPDESRAENDLGRFGLGMKTASHSQCRCLTVLSKKNGRLSAAEWDLDLIKQTGDWTLRIYEPAELRTVPCFPELSALTHGTVVVWREFDQLTAKEQNIYDALFEHLDRSRDHLELIFHRYLEDGSIKMDINGRPLIPKDPFLTRKSGTTPVEVMSVPGYEGEIRVIGYTLPHQNRLSAEEIASLGLRDHSMEDDQGFYLYRNSRLILWGSWLRMTRKAQRTKLSRVRVDVPNTMDRLWELDIRKSQASPPRIVRDRLSKLLDRLCVDSSRIVSGGGRISSSAKTSAESFWLPKDLGNRRFSVTINREASIYKAFCDSLSDSQQKAFLALTTWLETSYPTRWVNEHFAGDDSPAIGDEPDSETRLALKNQLRTLLDYLPDGVDAATLLKLLAAGSPVPSNRKLGTDLVKELTAEIKAEADR